VVLLVWVPTPATLRRSPPPNARPPPGQAAVTSQRPGRRHPVQDPPANPRVLADTPSAGRWSTPRGSFTG